MMALIEWLDRRYRDEYIWQDYRSGRIDRLCDLSAGSLSRTDRRSDPRGDVPRDELETVAVNAATFRTSSMVIAMAKGPLCIIS